MILVDSAGHDGWKVVKRRHAPFLQYDAPLTPIDFPGVGGINE